MPSGALPPPTHQTNYPGDFDPRQHQLGLASAACGAALVGTL